MTKQNNIEKAYDFGASEFNRKNDATPEELEELKAFDAWTRDGQPVED